MRVGVVLRIDVGQGERLVIPLQDNLVEAGKLFVLLPTGSNLPVNTSSNDSL
jgi:hypothetical protein